MSSIRRLPTRLEIAGCEPFDRARSESWGRRWAGVGLALFSIGITWAAQIALGLDLDEWWPVGVALAGITLIFMSQLVQGHGWEWVIVAGAALTVAGAILMYQVTLDRWESWSYSWPLVIPASIGIAAVISAAMGRSSRSVGIAGIRFIVIGVYLYVFGFLFLEGVLGIGDLDVHEDWSVLAPLTLLAGGIALIERRWPKSDNPPG